MRVLSFVGAAVAIVGGSVSANAAPPSGVRVPTSKWVVDFDDSQCLASRNYGTTEIPLILGLKAPPIGDIVQLMIVRPGRGGAYSEQLTGQISLDGREVLNGSMLVVPVKANMQRMTRVNMPASIIPALANATTMTVRVRGELNEGFQLSDMAKLMPVLNECVTGLRKHWNVGVERKPGSGNGQSAVGTLAGIFTANDYPNAAVAKMQGGTAKVAVLIDETGRVADCTVIETSGAAELDAQSCIKIKERAKFSPAQGPDGKPVRSSYEQRISWRIE